MEACRPATAGDLGRIAELARAMRAELTPMKGGALWAMREARPEPLEEVYGALLDGDDALLVVGTLDSVVIGFGAVEVETLRSAERLGVITDLFVEPDARAVGVGEALAGDLSSSAPRAGAWVSTRLHYPATARPRTSSRSRASPPVRS